MLYILRFWPLFNVKIIIHEILHLFTMALLIYPTVTIYILLINYNNNRRVQEQSQGKAKVFLIFVKVLGYSWIIYRSQFSYSLLK